MRISHEKYRLFSLLEMISKIIIKGKKGEYEQSKNFS